jgi:RNA polymerase sigma factor (TIGR02999 family)
MHRIPGGRVTLRPVVQAEEMRRILAAAGAGDRTARESLFALVYDELVELARGRRAAMGRHETLRTTDLVHESWLRLQGNDALSFESRRHFFGAAANAMRNILVDRARRRGAQKRDQRREQDLAEDLPELAIDEPVTDVLSLHLALEELERDHERAARVVAMRLFGGLEMQEIADVLGISLASIERSWRFGRAWLQNKMERDLP